MPLLARFSPHNDERPARLAGIGLMLQSVFMFSFGDALGKFVVATYSVGQLLCFRACAALAVLSPMIWRHRAEVFRLDTAERRHRGRRRAVRVIPRAKKSHPRLKLRMGYSFSYDA